MTKKLRAGHMPVKCQQDITRRDMSVLTSYSLSQFLQLTLSVTKLNIVPGTCMLSTTKLAFTHASASSLYQSVLATDMCIPGLSLNTLPIIKNKRIFSEFVIHSVFVEEPSIIPICSIRHVPGTNVPYPSMHL